METNLNIKRKVKVVNVDDSDLTAKLIEFEEAWFFQGEILTNQDKQDDDITLTKKISSRKFNYVGAAKVGEYYYGDNYKYEK